MIHYILLLLLMPAFAHSMQTEAEKQEEIRHLQQQIVKAKQKNLQQRQEQRKNLAGTKIASQRPTGYLMTGFGVITGLGALSIFNEKKLDKLTLAVGAFWGAVSLGSLGYGINILGAKAFFNTAINDYEVHGLFRRIKNKLF